MVKDKYFLDTNILIYAVFNNFDYSKTAKNIFFKYKNLYTSRQVLHEVYGFINSLPLKNRQKVTEYLEESLFRLIQILYITSENAGNIQDLVKTVSEYKDIAASILDVKLYYEMKLNRINNLITINDKDFKCFKDINVINPF